ncbi:hypothetical protein [Anabaena sp. CA = ATCC 33047]|uniref:hypothetical protein n=1 Tax=Anabaena sp. (strain CA / ATCC 33047) TaxID=52271 RepID=UPI000A3F400F|nr:hypothetical protein [Anabaena sp. CA = ATCC 33047]
MKKIVSFCFLITYGCAAESQVSKTVPQTLTGCPEKPTVVLNANNVKEISLNDQILKESAQASANKSIGYTFKANAGQEFYYKTAEDICTWLYTPDNQILNSVTLPTSGKYTLQVSAPKGSTSFSLEMSLQSPKTSINQQNYITKFTPNQSNPSPSINNNTSTDSKSIGWIWLGSINNTSEIFTYGEPLIPSKRQPVTITPSVVPSPGSVVTIKTKTNVRTNLPQPPNFKLADKLDKPLKSGQQIVIRRVEAFVDNKSDSKHTRIWAQIDKP